VILLYNNYIHLYNLQCSGMIFVLINVLMLIVCITVTIGPFFILSFLLCFSPHLSICVCLCLVVSLVCIDEWIRRFKWMSCIDLCNTHKPSINNSFRGKQPRSLLSHLSSLLLPLPSLSEHFPLLIMMMITLFLSASKSLLSPTSQITGKSHYSHTITNAVIPGNTLILCTYLS